jgi:drug/metabolite transporter (DMT)-like permease
LSIMRKLGTGTILTLVVLLGLLAVAIVILVVGWTTPEGGTPMSIHGYIAMGLGIVFTMALGGGLMFLIFYSSRHGRD